MMNRLWLPLLLTLALPCAQAAEPLKGSTIASKTSTICAGVLTGREISGDLQVAAKQNCTLDNTEVRGNVTLAQGSILVIKNSNIQGNVETRASFARLALNGAIVGGQVSAAQGGSFRMDDSQVVGQVSVQNNSGTVSITRVTINGNLNCAGNRSKPAGSWIRVDGVQSGQCKRL